ncbi:thioredoxin family protein [Pontibacter sp. CAU 1760]
MRFLLILLLSFGLHPKVQAQSIKWTAFEELQAKLRTEKKPLLIFIETDWCKYCKLQQNTTFSDPMLVQELNKNFYCLRLDAEHRQPIRFLNRTYQPTSTGYHELAELLAMEGGTVSFPTTLLLDMNLQLYQRFRGFIAAKELRRELKALSGR